MYLSIRVGLLVSTRLLIDVWKELDLSRFSILTVSTYEVHLFMFFSIFEMYHEGDNILKYEIDTQRHNKPSAGKKAFIVLLVMKSIFLHGRLAIGSPPYSYVDKRSYLVVAL